MSSSFPFFISQIPSLEIIFPVRMNSHRYCSILFPPSWSSRGYRRDVCCTLQHRSRWCGLSLSTPALFFPRTQTASPFIYERRDNFYVYAGGASVFAKIVSLSAEGDEKFTESRVPGKVLIVKLLKGKLS